MPDRVAHVVLGQLLEVGALAAALIRLDADLLQAAIARQPGVARNLGEVGIDAPDLRRAELFQQLAQSPARPDAYVRGRKRYLAPLAGDDRVCRVEALPRDQRQPLHRQA